MFYEEELSKGNRVLTVLKGEAEIERFNDASIVGHINAPRCYMEVHADEHMDETNVLLIDQEKAEVELRVNTFTNHERRICGKLHKTEDFKAFKINNGSLSRAELMKLVRFNGHCFDAAMHDLKKLHKDLLNYNLKNYEYVEKQDDRRGNTLSRREKTLEDPMGTIPKTLHVKMPIWKKTALENITVDVELEKTASGDVEFFLISSDLVKMQLDKVNSILAAELGEPDKWAKWNVALIYV